MRIGVQGALRVQADELEQLFCGAGAAALGQLLHLSFDEHGRVEGGQGVLVDHGDFAAAKVVHLLLAKFQQILAVVHDLAGNLSLGVEQSHDSEACDGLAATRFAHQTHGLARANHEAHVIDNVDIAMARELDAQIFDFQNGRHVGVRREAVGALGFHFAQGGETVLKFGCLSLVCQGGVGNQTVGFALTVEDEVACGNGCLRRCRHSIGDAFREDVEAQHRDHDRQAGE